MGQHNQTVLVSSFSNDKLVLAPMSIFSHTITAQKGSFKSHYADKTHLQRYHPHYLMLQVHQSLYVAHQEYHLTQRVCPLTS